MEFIIGPELFAKAISDVSRAVSLRTPFPILTGIKIIAKKDSVVLTGSNSDITIEKVIPTQQGLEVIQTGSVVVSAKYISEIVRKLPDRIRIKVNEKQVVTIQSGEIVTKLNGFRAEEFPSIPQMNDEKHIEITSHIFVEAMKQTAFATSKSQSRPVLTGVHLSFHENHLTVVATDSHRLAWRKIPVESPIKGSFIVPSLSLNELAKLMNNEEEPIHIFVSQSNIVFKSASTTFYSRLIEGNYPNTSSLIPTDAKTTITLETLALLKGIDRACLFSSERQHNNVQIANASGNKFIISSASTEMGKIEENQAIVALEGDPNFSITMDGRFLMDALKVIKEEMIKISISGSMRPVLIQPVNNATTLHLISPVRS